jgi:nicotinate-nucleotide adenylyltransferase
MRYGLLGGTFDPPHVGHAHIAREALRALDLDEVVWIPAYRNPLKRRKGTDAKRRLEMCRLAVQHEERMAVSDIEVTRGGDSFLVDTLEELKMVMPGDYWFILGADALAGFASWKQPDRVLQLCRLAVFVRHGTDLETTLARVGQDVRDRLDVVTTTAKAVSSSNIRDMAARGEDYSHLVGADVYDYNKKVGLYKD